MIVGLAAALGLLAVWAFGYLFVMRGVNGLVSAARQLATGNLNARTGLGPINGEIGQLATVFDEMADSLQEREVEQQLAQEKLRSERNFSDMLIESLPGIFMLFDRKGMFCVGTEILKKHPVTRPRNYYTEILAISFKVKTSTRSRTHSGMWCKKARQPYRQSLYPRTAPRRLTCSRESS